VSDATDSTTRDPREDIFVDRRPWGQFECFTLNSSTTVKIITVEAGHRLSLQRHAHRDELWTILDAPLDVEIAGEAWTAKPGEKIWIPRGTTHRVHATRATGRFLEIAFGHFDEDDIERLEDDYAR
jgi:mannose-6-phosphate isomerase-like protein (cupin superfamily)